MPWIMKAGKALNERKVEIRVQYQAPAAGIHEHLDSMRNELVVRPACWRLHITQEQGCQNGQGTASVTFWGRSFFKSCMHLRGHSACSSRRILSQVPIVQCFSASLFVSG